jgi:FdrA protein
MSSGYNPRGRWLGVLGYGARPDPCAPLLDAIKESETGVAFVAHVYRTEDDPQGMDSQIRRLREAGVAVSATNAATARLAVEIMQSE